MYSVEQILSDGLTENEVLNYSKYLNNFASLTDDQKISENKELSYSFYDVLDMFLTKNSDTILKILYDHTLYL